MSLNAFSLKDIFIARKRISKIVRKTPLMIPSALSKFAGSTIYLKLENMQPTGAFKIRGASNMMLSLSKEESERGVITVSSGNHGRAVAYVASLLGIKATICLPTTVPMNKRAAIQALGAEIRICGENYDSAMIYADQLHAETDMIMIPAFDNLRIIAGQGTIGLELLEEIPDLNTIIVPLSGGGLISGIAYAAKHISPDINLVGVSMDRGAAMFESVKAGKVVEIIEEPTLADALAGGLNKDNQFTLPMVHQFVDETILVSEEEIAEGIRHSLMEEHIVVEGGAAVGISALLSEKVQNLGKKTAVVISGGNISIPVLQEIINTNPMK